MTVRELSRRLMVHTSNVWVPVMVLKSILGRFGGDATAEEEKRPASHVCESCGEKYYSDPSVEIKECRACGGIRVEPV